MELLIKQIDDTFGRQYELSISKSDFNRFWSLCSDREIVSFKQLINGSTRHKMLALTMLVFTLEQNDEHNLSRNQEISRADTNIQIE